MLFLFRKAGASSRQSFIQVIRTPLMSLTDMSFETFIAVGKQYVR